MTDILATVTDLDGKVIAAQLAPVTAEQSDAAFVADVTAEQGWPSMSAALDADGFTDEQPVSAPLTAQEIVNAREAALVTTRTVAAVSPEWLDTDLAIGQTVSHKRGGPVERGLIVRFSKTNEALADVYFFSSARVTRVKVKNLRPATALV
jgi:hypothetical protein